MSPQLLTEDMRILFMYPSCSNDLPLVTVEESAIIFALTSQMEGGSKGGTYECQSGQTA